MKLWYTSTSPYVRKVMVSAIELGLRERLELIETNVWSPDTEIATANPLGKVPALILDDGHVLYDSPVICEYLDELVPGVVLFPAPGKARWQALHLMALSDGMTDAGVLRLLEKRRDASEQSEKWMDRQLGVVNRSLDVLESETELLTGGPLTIGKISVACGLGWLEFRCPDDDFLASRPKLAAWYQKFCERDSMKATAPKE